MGYDVSWESKSLSWVRRGRAICLFSKSKTPPVLSFQLETAFTDSLVERKKVTTRYRTASPPFPLFIGYIIEFSSSLVNPDNYTALSIKRAGSRTMREVESQARIAKTRFCVLYARVYDLNEPAVSSRRHAPSALSLACLDDILAACTFTILSARANACRCSDTLVRTASVLVRTTSWLKA